MTDGLFSGFDNGTLYADSQTVTLGEVEWGAHPRFAGVWMKELLPFDRTGGIMNALLVRIEAGHAISWHQHDDSMELHEVVAGQGLCTTEHASMPYYPGCMAVIPLGLGHEVTAGNEGLYLFAKFIRSVR